MLIGSAQGGMDIEAVAEKTPDAIIKEYVNIDTGRLTMECLYILKRKKYSHSSSTGLFALLMMTAGSILSKRPVLRITLAVFSVL